MPQRRLMELQVGFIVILQFLFFFHTYFFSYTVPGIVTMTDEEAQEHFDNFFEDVFAECEDKVLTLILFCLIYNFITCF